MPVLFCLGIQPNCLNVVSYAESGLQRKAGNELLAISHNANLSDGWMYPVDLDSFGRPIDAAWASSRDRNERLVEIKQIKGASETHPLLSPTDEYSSYEIFSGLLGLPPDNGRIDHIHGSFAGQALKDGIAMQDTRGYNPYKFGMAGGSDSHNTASPYRQDNFYGGHAQVDGTVERRLAGVMLGGTIDAPLAKRRCPERQLQESADQERAIKERLTEPGFNPGRILT